MTPAEPFRYRRLFPWLHLFRAFGISLALRQLLLSGLALVTLSLTTRLIDTIPVGEQVQADVPFNVESWITALPDAQRLHPALKRATIAEVARPWHDLLASTGATFRPGSTSTQRLMAHMRFAIALAIWSMFGVALCRLAAIQFARDEVGSFRQATQWAVTRWRQSVSAPLVPLAAAIMVMLGVWTLVIPSHLPWIGQVWLYLASPALLAGGCVVVVLLLAAVLGWPLMVAAIAVDDCDSFGTLSRSYSFWTGRPFHAIGFAFVAALIEAFILTVASIFFDAAIALVYFGAVLATSDVDHLAAINRACHSVANALLGTFEISLFWTNVTIIYLLLRATVDQRPFDQIAPDDSERSPRTPLPVVGIPATDAVSVEAPLAP